MLAKKALDPRFNPWYWEEEQKEEEEEEKHFKFSKIEG